MWLAIVLAFLINPAANAISEYGLQSNQSQTHELVQLVTSNTNSRPDRILQKKKTPRAQDIYDGKCCEFPETLPVYKCLENIQLNLFEDYDAAVAPLTGRSDKISVTTLLQFFAVEELNVMTSTLDIFVEIILSWKDPRLAWDVTPETCVASKFVRASNSAETTQIWVPELDLINRESGLRSMEDVSAHVTSDGTVRWIRSGKIKALCNFEGLGQMPFDTIGCRVGFRDSIIGDVKYNLVDSDSGPRGVSFPNFTQKYTEYTVVKEKTTSRVGDGSFVIEFHFKRANKQYIDNLIIPTIVFVCLSFGQFFFPSDSGERLTFCVTILLVVVAQSVVTSKFLPRCKESIWLNWFIISSQFFVMASTIESLILYCLIRSKRARRQFSESSAALIDCNDSNTFDMVEVYNDGGKRYSKLLTDDGDDGGSGGNTTTAPPASTKKTSRDGRNGDGTGQTPARGRPPTTTTAASSKDAVEAAATEAHRPTKDDHDKDDDGTESEQDLERNDVGAPASSDVVGFGFGEGGSFSEDVRLDDDDGKEEYRGNGVYDNIDDEAGGCSKMLNMMERVDYFAMFALPPLYVLYVIITFATVKTWDDSE